MRDLERSSFRSFPLFTYLSIYIFGACFGACLKSVLSGSSSICYFSCRVHCDVP